MSKIRQDSIIIVPTSNGWIVQKQGSSLREDPEILGVFIDVREMADYLIEFYVSGLEIILVHQESKDSRSPINEASTKTEGRQIDTEQHRKGV